MAKYYSPVLLGYVDEPILVNKCSSLDFSTNKIGGQPDWYNSSSPNPKCHLCNKYQLLVTQIYAPLEGTSDHRTLYIFSCINPKCSNVTKSWTCWRCQAPAEEQAHENKSEKVSIEWCSSANDWDVDDDNGNVVSTATDSDDSSLSAALGALAVDKCNANANANWLSNGDLSATAELEADESEVVTIDTPTAPTSDLSVLLLQNNTAFSIENTSCLVFSPAYISVVEEVDCFSETKVTQRLLDEYETQDGEWRRGHAGATADNDDECYEEAIPAHGDALFHKFISRIQKNPGQVLRYCRSSEPLLIGTIDEPRKCQHCQGALVFEMQLLPTLVSQLHLQGFDHTPLEFGNVLVYTCEASCWATGDTYREEVVYIQSESVY